MDGIGAYRENSVVTQPEGTVVVMLYDGAIRFLRKAVEAIADRKPGEKGKLIGNAVDIIQELNLSLNTEAGGDIAANLRSLYLFMIRHLNQANFNQDPQKVREVIALLEELRAGWKALDEPEAR